MKIRVLADGRKWSEMKLRSLSSAVIPFGSHYRTKSNEKTKIG